MGFQPANSHRSRIGASAPIGYSNRFNGFSDNLLARKFAIGKSRARSTSTINLFYESRAAQVPCTFWISFKSLIPIFNFSANLAAFANSLSLTRAFRIYSAGKDRQSLDDWKRGGEFNLFLVVRVVGCEKFSKFLEGGLLEEHRLVPAACARSLRQLAKCARPHSRTIWQRY